MSVQLHFELNWGGRCYVNLIKRDLLAVCGVSCGMTLKAAGEQPSLVVRLVKTQFSNGLQSKSAERRQKKSVKQLNGKTKHKQRGRVLIKAPWCVYKAGRERGRQISFIRELLVLRFASARSFPSLHIIQELSRLAFLFAFFLLRPRKNSLLH